MRRELASAVSDARVGMITKKCGKAVAFDLAIWMYLKSWEKAVSVKAMGWK